MIVDENRETLQTNLIFEFGAVRTCADLLDLENAATSKLNESIFARVVFDAAENEPSNICQILANFGI